MLSRGLLSLLSLLVAVMGLGGCAGNRAKGPGDVANLERQDAQAMNAEHSGFDSGKDPAFTVQTHFAAGQLAESQGAGPAAIQQYRAALKLDPHHLPSLYRLGVLYARQRAYPQAIAAWQIYIKETDSDPAAFSNLGFCHELAGQTSEAESAYKQGIGKDPRNNPCRVNYGLMLARAGRTNEAIIQLQAILPEAQVHYNLASIHEQYGRREDAKAEYRKALDLDPTLAEARSRLAAIEN
jgi:tetratricopeptide (TPR) repeat protein